LERGGGRVVVVGGCGWCRGVLGLCDRVVGGNWGVSWCGVEWVLWGEEWVGGSWGGVLWGHVWGVDCGEWGGSVGGVWVGVWFWGVGGGGGGWWGGGGEQSVVRGGGGVVVWGVGWCVHHAILVGRWLFFVPGSCLICCVCLCGRARSGGVLVLVVGRDGGGLGGHGCVCGGGCFCRVECVWERGVGFGWGFCFCAGVERGGLCLRGFWVGGGWGVLGWCWLLGCFVVCVVGVFAFSQH